MRGWFWWTLAVAAAVENLSSPQLEKIISSRRTALVEFYSETCGHCRAFAPEFEKVATALDKIVRVAATDDPKAVDENQIKGFPTVRLYIEGKPKEYRGQRTAKALVDWTFDQLSKHAKSKLPSSTASSAKGGEVIELDEDNFNSMVLKDSDAAWFVKFYAPWCGHCQRLEPTWNQLAKQMKGRGIKIAKVDATVHKTLASKYDVRGFPTLLLFPPGKKTSPKPYNGGRELKELVAFASEFAGKLEIEQILEQSHLDEACQKELCLISFLPHIEDSSAKERLRYLQTIRDAIKQAETPVSINYRWIEAGNALDFERMLRLEFGWPAAVLINAQKKVFVTHRTKFTKEALARFIEKASTGREPADPLPGDLKLTEKMKKWKAKEEL